MDTDEVTDALMRQAAFEHVRKLNETHDVITAEDLNQGFPYQTERIALINPRRGIFKPRQMRYLLSIKTVFPKPGNKVWYDDQREVHRQLFEADEVVDYAFTGSDPDAADNRHLREASEHRIPIMYFLGVAPGRYHVMMPAFIAGWDAQGLKAQVSFGQPEGSLLTAPTSSIERRYALRNVQQRLHQASFRQAVLSAYGGRCAVSGLPETMLLDAAHIVADADEKLGQPIVANGLALSKLHHAALDAHLIGIDPNFRVHVSDRLLSQRDGPTLGALQGLQGARLLLPNRAKDRPDRDRLALRFERFQMVA